MTISLDELEFLTSTAGAALLARLATEDLSQPKHLTLITRFRREYALDQVRAALSLALVRQKAQEKFGVDAARLYFTDDALQQASDPRISRYRAEQVRQRLLLDVCCGVGSDALAFARSCEQVRGVEIDPVRVRMAQLNAAALGLANVQFCIQDAHKTALEGADFLFFDPARRDAQGNRIHHVERYVPPLSLIQRWPEMPLAVKLSPAVDLAQTAAYGGGVEFISVEGDLKEALLWRAVGWRGTRATLILPGRTLSWSADRPAAAGSTAAPQGWLVEPDAALIRAGLVVDAAQALNGVLLDETIAYFTTPDQPASPWVRSWRILDWMPFHLKKLRAYLRERDIGVVTVKKRGSAITPEGLLADLKPKGDQSATLVLTRFNGTPIVLICADYGV